MSVKVMSQVWSNSQQSEGALLVLLAIADFANDDGMAYPSMPVLARKARLTERQVYRVLAKLQKDGELEIIKGGGRGNPNRYIVTKFQGNNVSESPKNPDVISLKSEINPDIETINPDIGDIETLTSSAGGTVIEPSIEPSVICPRWVEILSSDPRWSEPKNGYIPDIEAKYGSILDLTIEAHQCLTWMQATPKGKAKKTVNLTWNNWLKSALERQSQQPTRASPNGVYEFEDSGDGFSKVIPRSYDHLR